MKKLALLSMALMIIAASSALAADGKAAYDSGCAGCHAADGSKSAGGTKPLKELDAATIEAKLKGYAAGTEGGAHKQVMQNVAKKLSAEELKAVADYAGSL